MNNAFSSIFKLASGAVAGFAITQLAWVYWQLAKADPRFTLLVPQNRVPKGISSVTGKTEEHYLIQQSTEDGIERISYIPKKPRFKTPLLMQHGMFHGAWCWRLWQELFAEWGWESHAISLPGHGKSPEQRLVKLCTLDYYLSFLRDETNKMKPKPVIIGHSMGGALIQWYLKYVGQLPATVLVASWVHNSVMLDGGRRFLSNDPSLFWRMFVSWDASPWVRNPQRASKLLISSRAELMPEELYNQLGPESALVAFQHNPPFWQPPKKLYTPSLWLAGNKDIAVSVKGLRRSAEYYNGDFVLIPEAGHDLMLEHNFHETAKTIHNWLISLQIE
jgi:pimeloyl-ACP methyl ester carboxylesterase